MKESLLKYLACPFCNGAIEMLAVAGSEGNEVMAGQLICSLCRSQFPIVKGVPRFASLEKIEADKAATATSFGWQWQHFTQQDEKYAEQFLGWIFPVTPEVF